jgi:hypothetical protein
MNKTEDILEKLKAVEQPAIDNPDALTNLIMSNLPEQAGSPRQTGAGLEPRTILIALRIVSSIAALYLVGLFFYLQIEPTSNTKTAYNKVETNLPAPQPAYCTEGTPREILMCYLERKQAQPNTYSLLKQMNDESK